MTRETILSTVCVMSLAIGGISTVDAAVLPQLPQRQVDITMPTVTGSTLNATCTTLQAQLNAAAALSINLTHQIILEVGATCTGPYVLPSHNGGTGWILIKGANHAALPPSGTRVTVANAALMPQIQYGEDGAVAHVGCFSAATGAQRYRIIGIDCVENLSKSINWAMIQMGYAASSATNTGYIILDRVVIRDRNATHKTVRSIYGDTDLGHTALIDSHISGAKATDADTQAWLSVTNPGPILIQNNYLEAAGENFMTCGASPLDDAHQPRDITVRLNTFAKDPAQFGASGFIVKTMLETKCGSRWLIEANTFQKMPWNDGGYVFRLTPRNDNYTAKYGSFIEVSDLTIRYNLFSEVTNFINSIGSDDGIGIAGLMTKHSKRWHIHNNLIYGLGWFCGGGASCGNLYAIQDGGGTNVCTDPSPTCQNEDITFEHNTVDDVKEGVLYASYPGATGLTFRDNLINAGSARGFRSPSVYGTNFLSTIWGGTWTVANNRIAMSGNGEAISSATYPFGTNSWPTSNDFLWTNRAARDYTLQAGSPAKGAASDGTDQGVNFSLYNAARAGGGGSDRTPPATPQSVSVTIIPR